MRTLKAESRMQAIISLLISFALVFSLTPSAAFAEASSSDAQSSDRVELKANGNADSGQFATGTSGVFTQDAVEDPHDINVTVGLPSESNVKKDLYVGLTYNDNFFEKDSSVFNNDLAYASTCLAAAADNSNEGGDNYKLKSKNIVSYLQQIGCNDIVTNDGYNYKPLEKANIGVAIGYKDIRVNGKIYRLFVFGVRGGGYEEEWAVNMRVGTEGDATGFQEARDGALGFIMPYIKKHTEGLNSDVNVKVWGSGYCRGGTTTNMVFGWLNKWVYERNNGSPYKDYTQSYNKDHSVFGTSYSKSDMRYTGTVSFDPKTYLASNVKMSQGDLYAYPVNCPFGADSTDVNNHEPIMTGIHNLINPDDWFPQVVMDWWGFKRYGYTHDHDITGTYANDGDLHKRNLSVWNPTDSTRQNAVSAMINRLKQVDPNTAFNSTFFRQYYFSKAAAVGNMFKKLGTWIVNKINFWNKKTYTSPDIFSLSIDEKGEGNQFFSKGAELKYNQGAYYQEFMKFLLNSAGFTNDPAQARKYYVDNYQDAFIDLMDWVCGQPLEVREKFGKVASGKIKTAFDQMKAEGMKALEDNFIMKNFAGPFFNTTAGTYILYGAAAIWSVNDSSAAIPYDLIRRTLKLTFDELKIPYTDVQVNRASKAVSKLAYNFYDKEQGIAKFCFFHALTMYKAGSSIAQSHWPEQSLAWFSQCKPNEPNKKPTNDVKTQAVAAQANASGNLTAQAGLTAQAEVTNHALFAYFDEDPDVFYAQESRNNGEIVGVLDMPDALDKEGICINEWNLYSMDDFVDNKPALKTVTSDYVITASDPEYIVLTPIVEELPSKHVDLWLNKAMTGFDKDVLIGSFDVYDGGYWYIAYSSLPEGISDEGFDVLYYGDNKDLVKREGVNLEGWVVEPDSDENMTGFLPDDFVDYNDLPAGDTVNLYAVWYDPVIYGVTYHANRSSSDNYTVQSAEFAYDSNTIAITGLAEDDEGMQNPDKTFAGWNTKADGSGEWVNAGEAASLEKLGLGTRTDYLGDLTKLSTIQDDDEPSHYTEATTESNSEEDALEAELESKYTTHLYAQWKDKENTPQATTAKTSAKTTQSKAQTKTPATGDTTMQVVLVILVIALVAAVVLIAAFAKRRKKE